MAKKKQSARASQRSESTSGGRVARPDDRGARPAADASDPPVVVGLGASLVAVDDLEQLLSSLPEAPGLAVVVVGNADGLPFAEAERILAASPIASALARDGEAVVANRLYLAPAGSCVRIQEGCLSITPRADEATFLPIDTFFRSLAKDLRDLGIGILLKGTGDDGVQGLREIRARGGISVSQIASDEGLNRPDSAGPDVSDHVLPIERMCRFLQGHVARQSKSALPQLDGSTDETDLRSLFHLLRAHTGVDFRTYKPGTLQRRIQRRMGLKHATSLGEYLARLRESPDEVRSLFKDLLIHVTSFFREPEAWSALTESVIAPRVARREDTPIRVWVPGCSTGEEAYTIALLFQEECQKQRKELELQIFATDLNQDAVHHARRGVYPASIAADVSPQRLERFFRTDEKSGGFIVRRPLRDATIFAVQDLLGDPPFSNLDLISCRNILIYLRSDIQQRLLQMFRFSLASEGALFLGGSETIGKTARNFETVSQPHRIYRQKALGKINRPILPIFGGGDTADDAGSDPDPPVQPSAVEWAKKYLLARFAPASVLINSSFEVLYFLGDLRDYLDIPHGAPTTDLLSMCPEDVRMKLRGLVHQVLRHGRPARTVSIRTSHPVAKARLQISAEPVPNRKGLDPLLLVSFNDSPAKVPGAREVGHAAIDEDSSTSPHRLEESLQELERELQATREDLQSTIEELETSNEELKASNEEIRSMNEELQSSNEGLEISRHELQSLNRELGSVNERLEAKVSEVEEANNDLTNLLASTEIATLFVDTDLRLRSFTPATAELLSMALTDVGQPIRGLQSRLNDPDLERDAQNVLRKLVPVERRVCIRIDSPDAEVEDPLEIRWLIRRLLPYRTRENRIDGVVVTYTDVTRLQDVMGQLGRRERQSAAIAHLGRAALAEAPFEELLEEAARTLADTLESDLSMVLELQPSGNTMMLRAGVGWRDGVVGHELLEVPASAGSGRFTIGSADAGTPLDFLGAPLLVEHGARVGISAVIGPFESPWGVLGTHRKRPRDFDGEDAYFVQALANVLWLAIHRRQKEDDLRERERQLALVTDAMPVLIAYVDRDLVYRFTNRKYQEWFGLEPGQIIGKHVREVVGEGTMQKAMPLIDRVLAGERVSVEQRFPYIHGPHRDVRAEFIPHVLPSGEIPGYYAMVEDISDYVQHERLRERLASIVEHSSDAIIGKDLEGIVTNWNSAAEQMYGYSAEEMVGHSLTRITPPDRDHEVLGVIERLRKGERVENFETSRVHKDGHTLEVSLTASPIRDADGKLSGVSTIARNISERRERERALQESETRLRLAKAAARLGIHDYDLQTGIIQWDERIRSLWGVSEDEVIVYDTFLAGLHPDDRDPTTAEIQKALDPDGDGELHAEYRVIHPRTGETRWIEATGLVSFSGREPQRLVGTVLDVTERRRSEEALRLADQRKDEFLATLGHELRNPLAALVTAIECLRRGVDDSEREDFYSKMSRQASLMTTLLNDLLDIGRITRGDVTLRPRRVKAAEHIERAADVVRGEIDAGGHELEISVEPSDLELVADPMRLEQILVNLLSNAVTYSPIPGTIRLTGRVEGDAIEIAVEDSGIGFTQDEKKRLFEMFFQARRGSSGLGIGLSLIRSLMELHGGTADADSPGLGRGSRFRVRFPASQAPPEEEAKEPAPSLELSKLRILVVDDHVDSLTSLHHLLSVSCQVRSATTGSTGLEEARRFLPHVLLLDLALPDMTGIELAAAASEIPGLEESYRIAMTGFGDPKTLSRLENAEFWAHLIKPIDFDRLFELLGRVATELE
ncbi:MAG: PAS domain S-box protein [Planctomycetota bacterium]